LGDKGVDPIDYLTETLHGTLIPPPLSQSMKICPNCQMRYEDDALRFCTRDGSPLVDEGDFADSAALDVSGTLPQKPGDTQEMHPIDVASEPDVEAEIPRIVIQPKRNNGESGRLGEKEEMAKKSKKGGTLKTVLVTAFVTTLVLIAAGGAVWMYALRSDSFLFGPSVDTEATPEPLVETSPTPFPSPSPTPSPSPEASPSPSPSPTPSPSPSPSPRTREGQDSDAGAVPRAMPSTSDAFDGRPRRVNP